MRAKVIRMQSMMPGRAVNWPPIVRLPEYGVWRHVFKSSAQQLSGMTCPYSQPEASAEPYLVMNIDRSVLVWHLVNMIIWPTAWFNAQRTAINYGGGAQAGASDEQRQQRLPAFVSNLMMNSNGASTFTDKMDDGKYPDKAANARHLLCVFIYKNLISAPPVQQSLPSDGVSSTKTDGRNRCISSGSLCGI